MVHIVANIIDFFLSPKDKGIKRTSGGIGKIDASAKAKRNKEKAP